MPNITSIADIPNNHLADEQAANSVDMGAIYRVLARGYIRSYVASAQSDSNTQNVDSEKGEFNRE
jgi:hypothetical protein